MVRAYGSVDVFGNCGNLRKFKLGLFLRSAIIASNKPDNNIPATNQKS
jgi:hypothetical protein